MADNDKRKSQRRRVQDIQHQLTPPGGPIRGYGNVSRPTSDPLPVVPRGSAWPTGGMGGDIHPNSLQAMEGARSPAPSSGIGNASLDEIAKALANVQGRPQSNAIGSLPPPRTSDPSGIAARESLGNISGRVPTPTPIPNAPVPGPSPTSIPNASGIPPATLAGPTNFQRSSPNMGAFWGGQGAPTTTPVTPGQTIPTPAGPRVQTPWGQGAIPGSTTPPSPPIASAPPPSIVPNRPPVTAPPISGPPAPMPSPSGAGAPPVMPPPRPMPPATPGSLPAPTRAPMPTPPSRGISRYLMPAGIGGALGAGAGLAANYFGNRNQPPPSPSQPTPPSVSAPPPSTAAHPFVSMSGGSGGQPISPPAGQQPPTPQPRPPAPVQFPPVQGFGDQAPSPQLPPVQGFGDQPPLSQQAPGQRVPLPTPRPPVPLPTPRPPAQAARPPMPRPSRPPITTQAQAGIHPPAKQFEPRNQSSAPSGQDLMNFDIIKALQQIFQPGPTDSRGQRYQPPTPPGLPTNLF